MPVIRSIDELRVTLALTGTSTIGSVGPHILRMPA
jgi:hypothetical protein